MSATVVEYPIRALAISNGRRNSLVWRYGFSRDLPCAAYHRSGKIVFCCRARLGGKLGSRARVALLPGTALVGAALCVSLAVVPAFAVDVSTQAQLDQAVADG